jgi:hypothetical protein
VDLQEHAAFSRPVPDFRPEDGNTVFLRKVDIYLQIHTELQPKIPILPHRRENLKTHKLHILHVSSNNIFVNIEWFFVI